MPLKSAVLATFVISTIGLGTSYSAEVAVATPINNLAESFDEAPETSGLPLVGLRLVSSSESSAKTLDLLNVAVALPAKSVREICVRVTTQDARYSALNPYRIIEAHAGSTSVRLDPITVNYKKHLGQYSSAEMAVKAYVSDGIDCNPMKALHLPEIGESVRPDENTRFLQVNVNSRGRDTSAILGRALEESSADRPVDAFHVEVRCNRSLKLAGLAFDTVCTLPIKDYESVSRRSWSLTIVMNDGFDDSEQAYSVYLP